jgi:hypothetical protein
MAFSFVSWLVEFFVYRLPFWNSVKLTGAERFYVLTPKMQRQQQRQLERGRR